MELSIRFYSDPSLFVPAEEHTADHHTREEAGEGDTSGGEAGVTISGACDIVLEPWVAETLRQGIPKTICFG